MSPITPNSLWLGMTVMLLVIGAILMLAVLVILIAHLRSSKEDNPMINQAQESGNQAILERKRKAAAAAVAIAITSERQDQPHEFPLPPTAVVSPWQAVMRAQNMNKRGPVR